MTWFLDGAAILFILFLGYIGFNRGLIEELGRLIGLIIAIIISMSNTKSVSDKIIGIPKIGSGLAKGNWEEIKDIINEVSNNNKIICVYL